jgi:hypothetical protein
MSGKLVLAGAAALVLLTAHLIVVGLAVRHLALPVAAAAGLALLAIAKHLGLLAPLLAWLRRRRPTPRS